MQVELAIGLDYSARKKELLAGLGAKLMGHDMRVKGATSAEVVDHYLSHRDCGSKQYFYTDQFSNALKR